MYRDTEHTEMLGLDCELYTQNYGTGTLKGKDDSEIQSQTRSIEQWIKNIFSPPKDLTHNINKTAHYLNLQTIIVLHTQIHQLGCYSGYLLKTCHLLF